MYAIEINPWGSHDNVELTTKLQCLTGAVVIGLVGVVIAGHVSPVLLPWLSLLAVAVGLAVFGLDLFSTQADSVNDDGVEVRPQSKLDLANLIHFRYRNISL